MIRLSILVVNWNTVELLRFCLLSIKSFPPRENFEVIVVDNASRDGSAAMVASEFPEVRLIASEVNTGYAGGNNLAFAEAGGEFLLTLNPDTEIQEGTLDEALAAMRRHPHAGALGVRQIATDGSTQSSVRGFPTVGGLLGDITGLSDSYRLARFDYESEGPAPQPMGTFLLLRREALPDPRRPFDEGYPIFFNEVDLLRRMADAGWPAIYTPRARILHHGGESTRQVRPMAIWESHRSLLRYLRHHQGPLKNLLTLPWLTPLVWIAAFARAKGYHRGFRS